MLRKIQLPSLQFRSQNPFDLRRFKARKVSIKGFGVFASSGLGRVNFESEPVREFSFNASWLRKTGVRPDKAMTLHVFGTYGANNPRRFNDVGRPGANRSEKRTHRRFFEECHLRIKRLKALDGEILPITSNHCEHAHDFRAGHVRNAICVSGRVGWAGKDMTMEF